VASAHSVAAAEEAERLAQTQRLQDEERSLSEEEASWASNPDMAPLQKLLAHREQLKQQQADFKRECKSEEQRLLQELASQEEAASNSQDSVRLQEVAQIFAEETEKAQKLRRLVGQKSRDVALLLRRIDDTPARAELMQYERRFRELYQQVASKSQETKKYFSSFNTLEEKKGFITKEVSLINSIHENFNKSLPGNRDKLVESVEGLVKNVQQNLERVEQRLASEHKEKEALQQQYDKLVEKQRKYFKLVKDFHLECQRNEELSAGQQS